MNLHPRAGIYFHVDGTGFPLKENGKLVPDRIANLAQWDDVIMDLGCVSDHLDIMQALRAAKPHIRLHAYVVMKAWNNPHGPAFFQKFWQLVSNTNGFLTTTEKQWWSFSNVNVANLVTMDALRGLIQSYVTADGWDETFLDVLIPRLWSATQGPETLDWKGMGFTSENDFLVDWRTNGPGLVKSLQPCTTNYGVGFPGVAEGNMTEEFDHDWARWITSPMVGALHLGFPSAWITSSPHSYDPEDPYNLKNHRFGIGSALLFGGYYSDGRYEGDNEWTRTRVSDRRWFPAELVHPRNGMGWLGPEQNAAMQTSNGLWVRHFDFGVVVVNPTRGPLSVYFPDRYRPIGGVAKKGWNVPPRDALIMERV